jgi:hypothetical protein
MFKTERNEIMIYQVENGALDRSDLGHNIEYDL